MSTTSRAKSTTHLYDTIVSEREHAKAFTEWREKVALFKAMFNGAGMTLINRKFRPWKEPGLTHSQSYGTFLKFYKFYHASKRVMRDVLNDIIFHRGLRGDELTTVFADVLVEFERMSIVNLQPNSNCSGLSDNSHNKNGTPASEGNADKALVSESSSSDDSVSDPSDAQGHGSNWNHSDDVSYDSDDVYDVNMFPGYGRDPRFESAPTFTYSKTT